jgi:hypothetical protein
MLSSIQRNIRARQFSFREVSIICFLYVFHIQGIRYAEYSDAIFNIILRLWQHILECSHLGTKSH